MMELTKIIDHLYLGCYNDIIKNYFRKIKPSVIINVAEECRNMLSYNDNIDYYHYSYLDHSDEDISKSFDEVADLIHSYISEGKNVFIHCHAGKSRSVAFVLVYLIKYADFNLNDAFNYVDKLRCGIYPNLGFVNQLMKYETELTNKSTLDYDSICIDYIQSTVGFSSKEEVIKYYTECNKDAYLTIDKIFESR